MIDGGGSKMVLQKIFISGCKQVGGCRNASINGLIKGFERYRDGQRAGCMDVWISNGL